MLTTAPIYSKVAQSLIDDDFTDYPFCKFIYEYERSVELYNYIHRFG
jgi:hypothetical protein